MDILDDMGLSKLLAKVFFRKVFNFKPIQPWFLRMFTNKRIIQNGFHTKTLQAQISLDISDQCYFFVIFVYILDMMLYTI